MRIIVDLPDEQATALAQFCKRTNLSEAEAICRGVAKLLQEESAPTREEALRAAFGSWKNGPVDARQYVDDLRSEWNERPGG